MSIAEKAVWIIERNSERNLSLNEIAKSCDVSRSHLANAFGTATGLSVMRYLRARRLSEAARALAGGAPDILAVALDAGYASHEAFTRAFAEQFGMTPESVRQRKNLGGLPIVAPIEMKADPLTELAPPSIREAGPMRIVGLAEPFSWADAIKIPAQWQRFMAHYPAIPAKIAGIPVGVCFPADDDGQFEYVCAAEVSRVGDVPKELVARELAPQTYAVFEHKMHVSKLGQTYASIWNRVLPELGHVQADAPVLERHNETFDPRTGGLTIWVPLAK